uniref:(California timema) hypothetical protein n=1 Tax=Timema californicum TaxID=61474 RepID=A0A7R9J152_TIMCA|nr:unnamed protein product [Timema californicum]
MPPNDGIPGGPMPPGFFPNSTMRPSPPTHPSSQPSPHPQPPPPHSQMMSSQPFMGPRYPAGPRPGVRMPQIGNEFNGPPSQPMMPSSMDPTRQSEGGEFVGWQGPPGMMNPRMNPPRGPAMGPMGPGSYVPTGGMRGPPPNSSMGPGGPSGPGGPGMPPMSMAGPGGRPQWQPNTSTKYHTHLAMLEVFRLFHTLDKAVEILRVIILSGTTLILQSPDAPDVWTSLSSVEYWDPLAQQALLVQEHL